ncbi:MAG: S4 domain-containing protein [Bacillota bacterium]
MSQLIVTWELYQNEKNTEERYCSNCGKKVVFEDSKARRHNANGKKIFQYAIYKCEKGHTWNKLLGKYYSDHAAELHEADLLRGKSYVKNQCNKLQEITRSNMEKISVAQCMEDGIKQIDILLTGAVTSIRLDKLLSQNMLDVSRAQIQNMIREGMVHVNESIVKQNYAVKHGETIRIYL